MILNIKNEIGATCVLKVRARYYGKLHLGYGAVPLLKLTLINAECTSFMLEQQIIA